jgi:hypothetical protein
MITFGAYPVVGLAVFDQVQKLLLLGITLSEVALVQKKPDQPAAIQ